MNLKEGITTLICIIILFILIAVLFLVKDNLDKKNNGSNNNNNNNTSETVTITYSTNGGESITSSVITKGDTIVLPTPVRKGYSFLGWYIDGKKVDEDTVFSKNITLEARWVIIDGTTPEPTPTSSATPTPTNNSNANSSFKVTFDTKGGSSISPITVACNNTPLNLPEDPTKSGYEFTGWVDKNNNSIKNGSVIECKDIALYATWKKATAQNNDGPRPTYKYTITFVTGTGVQIDPVTLECDKEILELPELPSMEVNGSVQKFGGWFDENNRYITEGSILECKNIKVYARWIMTTPTPAPIN